MVIEAAGPDDDSPREGRRPQGPFSQLLWMALLLGYVAGVAAAIALLPGPLVEPVIVPVAIAGVVLGLAGAGWLIVGRWRRGVAEPRAIALASAEERPEPAALEPHAAARGDLTRPPSGADGVASRKDRAPGIAPDELRHLLFDGAVDPFVRPIVPMVSRPFEMLHAVPRLRQADGTLLPPSRYRPAAARAGLRALLDQVLVVRCAHLIAHALAEGRDVLVFCDVAPSSVADPEFHQELGGFLDQHHHLATRLVLEFDRTRLERPASLALADLKRTGLRQALKRFSASLHDPPAELAARGFDFVKLELAQTRIEAVQNDADHELYQLDQWLAEARIDLVLERFDDGRELMAVPRTPAPAAEPAASEENGDGDA